MASVVGPVKTSHLLVYDDGSISNQAAFRRVPSQTDASRNCSEVWPGRTATAEERCRPATWFAFPVDVEVQHADWPCAYTLPTHHHVAFSLYDKDEV